MHTSRPRYQARVQKKPAVKPEGRWEPRYVLDALNDLHNAPEQRSRETAVHERERVHA